jgi:hypothetical protein
MGLAYNLKNSDSGLGDLRQKKDEILALNFLEKNKDRTNNTNGKNFYTLKIHSTLHTLYCLQLRPEHRKKLLIP